MGLRDRVGDRASDRAAIRALYLGILASTVGLTSYNEKDDKNLDTLDGIIADVYSRKYPPQASVTLEARPAAQEPEVVDPKPQTLGVDEAAPVEAGRPGTVEEYRPGSEPMTGVLPP